MTKVIADITMSVDGYVAGPNISHENPLGVGGHRLHHWLFHEKTEVDSKLLQDTMLTTGAVILGHRTYATAIDDAWGGENPFQAPAYVLCHTLPATQVKGFTYVMSGIHAALLEARLAADQKKIWVMGGASILQQYLRAGLIDELHLHIAPVILNGGTRLFEYTGYDQIELRALPVQQTRGALHTLFEIVKN